MGLKDKGLYHRYEVKKVSGRPINPKAKYFVLRYDKNGDDLNHIRACQTALLVYAQIINNHIPLLSEDLKRDLKKESIE